VVNLKIIKINKKNIIKITSLILFFIIISLVSKSFSMQHYYDLDFSTGLVTNNLNVRSGPGTNYKVVTTVNKNEYIHVFAGVGDWYIVQVEGDYIGAVSKKYVKPINSKTNNTSNNVSASQISNNSSLSTDELEVFNLINTQRASNRSSSFKIRYRTSTSCQN